MAELKVFISYRRADLHGHASALVGRIYDRLSTCFGEQNVFMDVDTIPPGVDFARHLHKSVAEADVLLAVVGPDWIEILRARDGQGADYVRTELEAALASSMPVVPLLVGGAAMPASEDLPDSLKNLRKRNAFSVGSGRDFNVHMTRLIDDLNRHFRVRFAAEGAVAVRSRAHDPPPARAKKTNLLRLALLGLLVIGFALASVAAWQTITGKSSGNDGKSADAENQNSGSDGVAQQTTATPTPSEERNAAAPPVSTPEPEPKSATAPESDGEPKTPAPSAGVPAAEPQPKPEPEPPTLALPIEGETHANSLGMELLWCEPGQFVMGDEEEGTVKVTLSEGFWMGKTEVTQGHWERLMGDNPSRFADSGAEAPVENVSWDEAMEFCRKLTDDEHAAGGLPEGWHYTLPTEAQWEYACRAGTTTAYSFGDDDSFLTVYGWFDTNSDGMTHPVASKKPNPWGFYDFHGNVREWCADWWGDLPRQEVTDPQGSVEIRQYRVNRGGDYNGNLVASSSRRMFQSAGRSRDYQGTRFANIGFRVALRREQ